MKQMESSQAISSAVRPIDVPGGRLAGCSPTVEKVISTHGHSCIGSLYRVTSMPLTGME